MTKAGIDKRIKALERQAKERNLDTHQVDLAPFFEVLAEVYNAPPELVASWKGKTVDRGDWERFVDNLILVYDKCVNGEDGGIAIDTG